MENIRYFMQVLATKRSVLVGIVGVGVISVVLVANVLVSNFLEHDAAVEAVATAEPVLSRDAIEAERAGLPHVMPEVASTSGVVFMDASAVTFEALSDASEAGEVSSNASEATTPIVKEPVFTSTDQGVSVGRPIVTGPSSSGASETETVSGTIVGIDIAENLITVVGGGAVTQVTVTSETIISVGSKQANLETLAINDVVTVEGAAVPGSGELTARTINVTSVFTITPF